MADTEMTIRLVDASEEENQAFNAEPQRPPEQVASPQTPEATTKAAAEPQKNEVRQSVESRESTTVLESLRDALVSLTERFAPESFQRPIARLIEALTGRKEPEQPPAANDSKTVEAPPVQDAAHLNESLGKFVTPPPVQEPKEAKQPKNESTQTKRTGFNWLMRGRQLLERTRVGRKVVSTFDRVRPAATAAAKAVAGTKLGRRVLSAAAPIAKRFGISIGTAAATTGAASAGAAGGASTGAAAAVGAAAMANPIGISVAAVVAAFSGLAIATKALSDVFSSQSELLRRVSPQIEIALSRRQMNTELNQLERANRIGNGLGRFENAKTNLQDQQEKLVTQILQLLIRLEPVITTVVDVTTYAALNIRERLANFELHLAAINQIIASFTPDPQDDIDRKSQSLAAAQALGDVRREMADFLNRQGISTGPDPLLQQVMGIEFDAMGNPIAPGPGGKP
jgi:hypothetical protein